MKERRKRTLNSLHLSLKSTKKFYNLTEMRHYTYMAKFIDPAIYSNVHIYVVIHFCDSMWPFRVEVYLFYHLLAA
jgi:hypothetical protein